MKLTKHQKEIVKYLQENSTPVGVFNYSKRHLVFQPTWYGLTYRTVKILVDNGIVEVYKCNRLDEYIRLTDLGKTM